MTREEAIKQLELLKLFDCPLLLEAKRMAVAALREQEKWRWIPVTERLPQKYGDVCKNVNLLMDDGFVTVGWLNQVTNKGYYLDAKNDYVIHEPLSRFTHWMPLPELPKEDEQ